MAYAAPLLFCCILYSALHLLQTFQVLFMLIPFLLLLLLFLFIKRNEQLFLLLYFSTFLFISFLPFLLFSFLLFFSFSSSFSFLHFSFLFSFSFLPPIHLHLYSLHLPHKLFKLLSFFFSTHVLLLPRSYHLFLFHRLLPPPFATAAPAAAALLYAFGALRLLFLPTTPPRKLRHALL